jgi:predicted transcriptional regulator
MHIDIVMRLRLNNYAIALCPLQSYSKTHKEIRELANKTIEGLLQDQHGDLHTVIPEMVTVHGQEKAAHLLGVTQSWISRWLRENGYVEEKRWIRQQPEAS